MSKKVIIYISLSIALLALGVFPQSSYAVAIFGNGPLGSFEGEFTYTAAGATSATLVVLLKNTTNPLGNPGYLTAFVFNNPANRITGVTITTKTNPNFNVIGGLTNYIDGINGASYGQFDIGASTSSSFEGGGPGGNGDPSRGIPAGGEASFTFALTGLSGLDSLNENSFFSTLSVDPGAGRGYESFVARFRGFEYKVNEEDSDKVPGHVIPEPTSLSLLGLGLVGLLTMGNKRTRKEKK